MLAYSSKIVWEDITSLMEVQVSLLSLVRLEISTIQQCVERNPSGVLPPGFTSSDLFDELLDTSQRETTRTEIEKMI